MSRVSFLLPIYSSAQFLGETLQSILAQDYKDFDVVIIDDGSTDDTAAIIHQFDDPRIKYHKTENGGLVNALNNGLEKLDCAYVARIDADDICLPYRLSRQLDFIQFTNAAAVSSQVVNINEAGRILGLSSDNERFFFPGPQAIPAHELYLPHPFMMARLDVLHDIGRYRHAHLSEDADLCWRLADQHRIALQWDVMGHYRLHSTSISNQGLRSGRVQAFYAQLAALSAVRRKAAKPEVSYDLTMQESIDKAVSITGLIDAFAVHLSECEKTHFAAATTFKYLDTSTYRYMPLAQADIDFAWASLPHITLGPDDKIKVDEILNAVQKKSS